MTSSGAGLGQAFQVNTQTVGEQDYPDVAFGPDGGFVVVWEGDGQDGSFNNVYGRRFMSSGAPIAQEFKVNVHVGGQHEAPALAVDAEGDFVVAWRSSAQDGYGFGVFARRFGSGGAAFGGEFQTNSFTASSQRHLDAAGEANGDFVVVWTSPGQDGSEYGLFAQRFSSSGAPLGTEFQVNSSTIDHQFYPAVAADADGDFVVAWWSLGGEDGSGQSVLARRFDSSGAPRGDQFVASVVTMSSQGRPQVTMDDDGDFVIAWQSHYQDGSSYGVVARRFASTGAARSGDLQVNSYTTGFQASPPWPSTPTATSS